MDKISLIEVEQTDGSAKTFVIIDRGNDEFTSMTKAHYEELEAAKAEVKP